MSPPPRPQSPAEPVPDHDGQDRHDASPPDLTPPDVLAPFCGPHVEVGGRPIDNQTDVVTFLDTLPRPLTMPCVLAALPRPLAIVGTTNPVSAQPAAGSDNPRLFLASGRLIFAITLAGETSSHLETAEPEEMGFSVKGDLALPRSTITEQDFFAGIMSAGGTASVCSGCHAAEHEARRVGGIPAFASIALKPSASQTVLLAKVRALADACEPDDDRMRCQMLRALFREPEAVTALTFPDGARTFF